MWLLVLILSRSVSFGAGVLATATNKLRHRDAVVDARDSLCNGLDCSGWASRKLASQATPLTGGATCRCCWRDCEDEVAYEKHQESMAGGLLTNVTDAEDVDVWIYSVSSGEYEGRNMYTPIFETVRYGLRNVASNIRIVGSRAFDSMRDGIRAAAAKGKQPLVLATLCWHWDNLRDVAANLKTLRESGAYLVLYQLEPFRGPEFTVPIAHRSGAHEIWDYALANVDSYPEGLRSTVRFVPPGYAPSLEIGVDLKANLRDEAHIGYMGSWGWAKPISFKYSDVLGKQLIPTNSVWSEDDLRRYLGHFPVQLNVHKQQTCCPRKEYEKRRMHMEAFRFSDLLSNKACIISAPGSDKDNSKWAAVVHIAEVEDTGSKFEEVRRNVTKCQLESYERFKIDFDAEKLLRDSGFLDAWSPVRLSKK